MRVLMLMFALTGVVMTFSACEKNDYKHPLHRAQGK